MKPWSKLQSALIATGLAQGLVMGLSWATVAPYLKALGFTGSMYGVYGGLSVFTLAFVTLAAGPLSDRFGGRIVGFIGAVVTGFGFILLSTGSLFLVYLAALVNGFGGGLLFTSMTVLVSRSGSDEFMHYRFSYFAASQTFGGGIGSFLGWIPVYVSHYTGVLAAYSYTLAGVGLLSIASSPLIFLVREINVRLGEARLLSGYRGLGVFWWVVLINGLIGFAAAMSIHNIDYYFTAKYHVNSGMLGSVFGFEQLVMAGLMLWMPSLSDRVGGPLKLYLTVSLSSIPLLVLITLTDNYLIASSLFITRSVLMNVANPLFTSFALSLVAPEKRGVASGLMSLSWTLPGGFGRMVGGYLFDLDLELPLRLTALIYTVSLLLLGKLFYASRKVGNRGGIEGASTR
jgi:MFS family permease